LRIFTSRYICRSETDSERTARLEKGKAPIRPERPPQARDLRGQPSYAQRLQAAPPAPPREQTWQEVKRIKGGSGKPETTSPLALIKGSIPHDERTIIFERTPEAPQLDWITVNQTASHVNNSLGKVAPAHVRTEKFRVFQRGVRSTTARQGDSAAIVVPR
jgi:hypothetical protein